MIRWTLVGILSLCAFWIGTSTLSSFRSGKPVHIYRSPLDHLSFMAVADHWQLRLWHWSYQSGAPAGSQKQGSMAGFSYDFSTRKAGNGMTLVTQKLAIPSVVAFAPAFAFPVLVIIRRPLRRWKRLRNGKCLKCGYDLSGAPEPRCPECGTVTNQLRPGLSQTCGPFPD
jgi:hypothetical protein